MKRIPLVFLLYLAASVNAYAVEAFRTNVVINNIFPVSGNRPASPASQDVVRVNLPPAAWGSTSCNTGKADILKADTHLVSVLLAAWVGGKTISLSVDDSARTVGDICQVTTVQVE